MTRKNRCHPDAAAASPDRGAALILTLLVMAITMAMAIGLLTSTVTDMHISANFRNRAGASYAADSGIQQTVADLRSDPRWIASLLIPGTWQPRSMSASDLDINGQAIAFVVDSEGMIVADRYPLGGQATVGEGRYTRTLGLPPVVDLSGDEAVVTFAVRSTGTNGEVESSTQIVRADLQLTVDSYGVWDNAIFAGSGLAGNVINGNVVIRGSVHIVGDPADPPAIQLSGTAGIGNNYADAAARFGAVDAAKLPALDTVEVNGVQVQSLEAVVRIEHGSIGLSGNAEIGQGNDDANAVKETLDAIRTNGTVGPDDSVHADDYDAYDTVGLAFPSLDDPYYDEATATNWGRRRDYLDATALTITIGEISRDVAAFSLADAAGNSIRWDPDSGHLEIAGIVRFDGDLRLGKPHGKPGERGFHYSGTGTLFATGNIEVDGWVVPADDYLYDGNLGLIAAEDVLIDEASQINVMAAIYAEDTIRVSKQTNIAGALVGNYFNMGTNVPSVFHVPQLSSNLPPGMPGAGPIAVILGTRVANWYPETAR